MRNRGISGLAVIKKRLAKDRRRIIFIPEVLLDTVYSMRVKCFATS